MLPGNLDGLALAEAIKRKFTFRCRSQAGMPRRLRAVTGCRSCASCGPCGSGPIDASFARSRRPRPRPATLAQFERVLAQPVYSRDSMQILRISEVYRQNENPGLRRGFCFGSLSWTRMTTSIVSKKGSATRIVGPVPARAIIHVGVSSTRVSSAIVWRAAIVRTTTDGLGVV